MNTSSSPNYANTYPLHPHYAQRTIFLPNSAAQAMTPSQGAATMAYESNPAHSFVFYSLGTKNGFGLYKAY